MCPVVTGWSACEENLSPSSGADLPTTTGSGPGSTQEVGPGDGGTHHGRQRPRTDAAEGRAPVGKTTSCTPEWSIEKVGVEPVGADMPASPAGLLETVAVNWAVSRTDALMHDAVEAQRQAAVAVGETRAGEVGPLRSTQ